MRTYHDHRRSQHAIDQLRPQRREPAQSGWTPTVAARPVGELAPLPPPPAAATAHYCVQRLDARRRVAVGAARRLLGWESGQAVLVRAAGDGQLLVEAEAQSPSSPSEAHRTFLDAQGRIRLTDALLAAAGMEARSQLLVRVCPEAEGVRLVSAAALESAFADHEGEDEEVVA